MKENYGREDSCYGVTKDPNESDYMLIFKYDVLKYKCILSEIIEETAWKYRIDELMDELFDSLNEIINKEGYLKIVRTVNELLETLRIIENCTSYKDKIKGKRNFDKFHYSINEIENWLAELKKNNIIRLIDKLLNRKNEQGREEIFNELDRNLEYVDRELNQKVLCESCKEKKIEKLTDKCENEEIAKLLYDHKLNAKYYNDYIRWIPFDEFENIKYLAKGGFGEVHKATWVGFYYNHEMKYKEWDVVLKRIYNNSSDDKIVDTLKEVK